MPTFVTPFAPSFSSAATTTTSPDPNGSAPAPARFTPGIAFTSATCGSSTPLSSSALEPFRSTIATSAFPAEPSVRRTPSESISADESTNTTSAMPIAVAAVVARRTNRLRRL